MSSMDQQAIQPSCPKCSGRGLARGLQVTANRRTLRCECDICNHEWHVIDQDPMRTWNGVPISSPVNT